jgi:hypothetical protein
MTLAMIPAETVAAFIDAMAESRVVATIRLYVSDLSGIIPRFNFARRVRINHQAKDP